MPALTESRARVWDGDMSFVGSIASDALAEAENCRILTLPLEHLVNRWILTEEPRGAVLTVDSLEDRWIGRLWQYEIKRVGECPHCSHCMETVVVSEWRDKPW